MQIISVIEAEEKLLELIEQALAGQEVIIGERGEPLVKLVPYFNERDTSPRDMSVRIWEGEAWMAEDFDELLENLLKIFIDEARAPLIHESDFA